MDGAYLAVLTPSAGGAYGIDVPDLPGCFAVGANREAAIEEARAAAHAAIARMLETGQIPPTPRSAEVLKASGEVEEGELVELAVQAHPKEGTIAMVLELSAADLAAIDAKAEALGMGRAAFLVAAAMAYGGPQAPSGPSSDAIGCC